MARKVSSSQFKSMVRQAQTKHRQAVAKINGAISKYNQEVNRYNAAARTHNARVRSNRARLKQELTRLSTAASQPRYVTLRTSVESVHRSYVRLEQRADAAQYDDRFNEVLDLSEREAANSASVMNALLGQPEDTAENEGDLSSELDPILSQLSGDALDRWHGALFSLNPRNPDAARHFCTSARELLETILVTFAPNQRVKDAMPDCETIQSGGPSRRARIRYFLHLRGMQDDTLEDFVDEDLENVVQLFRVFNDGTHGSSGRFTHAQLVAIRKRVEGAITYLWNIIPQSVRTA